jgi:PAS domain S-box-containing protein
MPNMSGIEMIAKLRAANMTLPVIMATGLLPMQDFVRRPWLKPDVTLGKPFSNAELLAVVRNLLGTDDGGSETSPPELTVIRRQDAKAGGDLNTSEIKTKTQNENLADNGTRTEQALRASELSYRRLFEAAKDGILILDVDTGRISDANPFLFHLLGFSHGDMVGKTVGELSPFKDIESNQIMLERLQKDGYVRYEDLPLETRDGRHIAVEFVSNVYQAGDKKVIQCNVRDISASSNARRNCRPPTRNWRRSAIPSPTICARRCAMSRALCNCWKKKPDPRWPEKVSSICGRFPKPRNGWGI